jgi:hypothetical protein
MALKRKCAAFLNSHRSPEWKRCGALACADLEGIPLCNAHLEAAGGFLLALLDAGVLNSGKASSHLGQALPTGSDR